MQTKDMPLAQIKPYEGNPRRNESAIDRVAESIRRFGVRQPIVVDSAGVIIVGHTRLFAAQKLNMKTFPVHVAKDMSAEAARLYRIADNRTAEFAAWDFDKLRDELEKLGAFFTTEDLAELGMSISDWPEIALEDLEDINAEDTDQSTGARADVLKIGDYKIPMTGAELSAMTAAVVTYADEHKTLFGFARWLLEKAGLEVSEEVPDAGDVETLA